MLPLVVAVYVRGGRSQGICHDIVNSYPIAVRDCAVPQWWAHEQKRDWEKGSSAQEMHLFQEWEELPLCISACPHPAVSHPLLYLAVFTHTVLARAHTGVGHMGRGVSPFPSSSPRQQSVHGEDCTPESDRLYSVAD